MCTLDDFQKESETENNQVKILMEDLSEYVPEKSHNGGCYGFASAKVVEVIEVGY